MDILWGEETPFLQFMSALLSLFMYDWEVDQYNHNLDPFLTVVSFQVKDFTTISKLAIES